jgi:hypothetical protein
MIHCNPLLESHVVQIQLDQESGITRCFTCLKIYSKCNSVTPSSEVYKLWEFKYYQYSLSDSGILFI